MTNFWPDSLRKKEESSQKIRNEKEEVSRDNAEIQKIIRNYYEQLHRNKINGQFLGKVQSSKTEPRRNRNYEQPNYKP